MSLQVIVGIQWGDEGKGRMVDWLASHSDYVARFNGGDNAGHTVTIGSQIYKLHLLPSGIIHPNTIAVLGNGMVINPKSLLAEMDLLRAAGVSVTPERLHISYAAHLITPAHQAMDKALEVARGKESLGTTGRGIGPAYTDKASRRGLRMGDMLALDFMEQLRGHFTRTNQNLAFYGTSLLDIEPILIEFEDMRNTLAVYIKDVSGELHQALTFGKTVLAEGAQGTLLDIDHGSYPFVTSSVTTAPGVLTGLGLGFDAAQNARVIGVVKAFQTRVGSGPFPSELSGELAGRLRGTGSNPWDEFGTTTGRPRRVGWLDGVLLRYAARINGLTEIVLTKLDILSGFENLRICTSYRLGENILSDLPFGQTDLSSVEPVYLNLPGWEADLTGIRLWQNLPIQAQEYIRAISRLAQVPVRYASVGPEREQILEVPALNE
ncbi:MAG TPA: adenylosuccinate synthase [Anaerolineales bacterium]|nr:adenylosuccinate synthase [Anaerolineales bacterium]